MRRHRLSRPTWRPPRGRAQRLRVLRYASIRTPGEPTLFGDSVHYEIHFGLLKALQSSQRSLLFEDGPSSLGAVAFRDQERVRARSAVAICHSRLAWLPYRYINLLCARLAHRLCSSRLLLLAPMCVVERIVDLSRNPQAVQKHRELPRCGHHHPLLGVLAATGGYLFSVATEVRVGAKRTQCVVGA